jgi:hypothetical protein
MLIMFYDQVLQKVAYTVKALTATSPNFTHYTFGYFNNSHF